MRIYKNSFIGIKKIKVAENHLYFCIYENK